MTVKNMEGLGWGFRKKCPNSLVKKSGMTDLWGFNGESHGCQREGIIDGALWLNIPKLTELCALRAMTDVKLGSFFYLTRDRKTGRYIWKSLGRFRKRVGIHGLMKSPETSVVKWWLTVLFFQNIVYLTFTPSWELNVILTDMFLGWNQQTRWCLSWIFAYGKPFLLILLVGKLTWWFDIVLYGCFQKLGWFIMETPIKIDGLGVPPF